ncbi:MAG: HD domain-containing protein [Lachnospiraceae bacterium]|nr:HD domain-containing protein [Lachnospiraceae bacterium]
MKQKKDEQKNIKLLLVLSVVLVLIYIGGTIFISTRSDVPMIITILFISIVMVPFIGIILYIASRYNANLELLNKNAGQMQDLVMQTISTVARTIDAKDEYTEGHSARVAEYSRLLARELGKNEDEARNIYFIALLHDIGKIGIPDSVLHKPGRLTKEEFELVKQHPVIGAKILRDIKAFPDIEIGAHYHHERYDGTGYPEGLKGEEIPEIARIIAVADSYDAMNSNRVYRHHFKKDNIAKEIEACKGTQFDPVIADAMISLLENDKIRDNITVEAMRTNRRSGSVEGEVEGLLRINEMLLDSLADDYSERYLMESLSDEVTMNRVISEISDDLAQKHNGCLFLLDVDGLRVVNQKHGFLVGDYALAAIAETLIAKEHYLIVARVEGDEFLGYMADVSSLFEVQARLSRLIKDIGIKLSEIPELTSLTVSIGAAYSRFNGYYFYRLLGAAEKSLLLMKQEGGDGYRIFKEAVPEQTGNPLERDLDNLSAILEHKENHYASFSHEYAQFQQTYDMIRSMSFEDVRFVQLVLFSLEENDNISDAVTERAAAMESLKQAISSTVRNVDMTIRYSNTQQLVFFMNLPDEHIGTVVGRIIKEFYRMSTKDMFRLGYAVRNVNVYKGDEENEV